MSRLGSDRVGIVVGLAVEARIAQRSGCLVEIGGGTAEGAQAAAHRLIAQHVTVLVSFGLAGGLDPLLRPGDIIVPDAVVTRGHCIATSAAFNARFGGPTPHWLLGADRIAASSEDKRRMWLGTGCAAVDLESGAVALTADAEGIPFAVLRAICDPAGRDLPPAALAALDGRGAIGIARVIASVIAIPWQIPSLLALARDATAARQALLSRVEQLR
jgi:adenosylhomocysteine nucleosidase